MPTETTFDKPLYALPHTSSELAGIFVLYLTKRPINSYKQERFYFGLVEKSDFSLISRPRRVQDYFFTEFQFLCHQGIPYEFDVILIATFCCSSTFKVPGTHDLRPTFTISVRRLCILFTENMIHVV